MDYKKAIVTRLVVVYFLVAFFAGAVLFRIIDVMFVEGAQWRAKALEMQVKEFKIPARRGDIYARDGRLLATSIPYYDVGFDPNAEAITDHIFRTKIDSVANGLARVLGDKSSAEYKRIIVNARHAGRHYCLLKTNVSYDTLQRIKRIPLLNRGKYKGGLAIDEKSNRIRPFNELASRTIGYTGEQAPSTNVTDTKAPTIIGVVGLERAYERELRGISGVCIKQRIAGGLWMPIDDGRQLEPRDGYNIHSTIDIDIQDVAQNALRRGLDSNMADWGCAILMEVQTGEVRAIANMGLTKSNQYAETFNYSIGFSSEPGSTFKLASLMAAFEDGYAEPDDSVDTQGGIVTYYGKEMHDSHDGGYGMISLQHGFEVSSNVAVSKVIVQNYRQREQQFIDRLYAMRLNKRLGIELWGEAEPYIKSPKAKSWSGISLPWMSIGYEVHLTPLQILTLYNSVANDGTMVKPKFVTKITNKDRTIAERETEVLVSSICSNSTLTKVRGMLEGVVVNGTAKNVMNKNYSIAGKTGTCRINYSKQSATKEYQASFVGYFPADKPKYSCIVVINHPKRRGVYYGSVVAGSIFKEIADKVYATSIDLQDLDELSDKQDTIRMIGVPFARNGNKNDLMTVLKELRVPYDQKTVQNAEWVVTEHKPTIIEMSNRTYDQRVVPNVRGMGLRDAMFLLENAGLRVVTSGLGVVRSQSLQPGGRFNRGDLIFLELGS